MMRFPLVLAAVLALPPVVAQADSLRDAVQKDLPSLMALYRDLHANPELSMQEFATAAKLADEARRLGFTVTTQVGQTGVVAVYENGPGPVLLIRADMDALPVTEQTGLPFASRVRAISPAGTETGVMHACGHDTHMAAWVGAARRLMATTDEWSGTLVMILQPAEETGQGAKAMLADGLLTRFPRPQYALAFHDSGSLPAGQIGYTPGAAFATVDSVDLVVRGVGGHGAVPQATKDPIVLAARIVGTLQTLVSREIDPQEPAVVTVGSFQAGAKHNVIADEARLLLTVRSYRADTRQILLEGIERIARGEAIAAGVPEDRMPIVTIDQAAATPAAVNTPAFTEATVARLAARFGPNRVKSIRPLMVGEDFGRYHHADPSIESFMFMVGGVPADRWAETGGDPAKLPSLHSPFWAPDAETVIATGVEALVTAAMGVLGP